MPNLDEIAGLTDLWEQTNGSPRVCVAVLDGPADLSHPCFQGADVERVDSYWRAEGSADEVFAEHATHILSMIVGQHGSDVPGIAPGCRAINVAVAFDTDTVLCPLNLARAVDTALEAGADIVHVALCLPEDRWDAHDPFVERSIETCLASNVLVVAPAGNNHGRRYCVPATIPGVLAVGALQDDGTPYPFSNSGGIYQRQGLAAPGGNLLGAVPGGKTQREKGTSCAAPVVTGVAALLMSLQAQRFGASTLRWCGGPFWKVPTPATRTSEWTADNSSSAASTFPRQLNTSSANAAAAGPKLA